MPHETGRPPADLQAQLERDEGLRLKPYVDCCRKSWRDCVCDTKGRLTIGYGRNLDDKGISLTEARAMLGRDILDARSDVVLHLSWTRTLDEIRVEVLANMAFNIGIAGLVKHNPRMLTAVERGDYAAAAREMLDGPWKDQVGPRAFRLARQMDTGIRQ